MLPQIDSCSLTIRYPSLDRELDECLPADVAPAYHRWLDSLEPWEAIVKLRERVAPRDERRRKDEPAKVVADIVEYGLAPAAEVARRDFPDEMEAFCEQVAREAFDDAPVDHFRLVCLDFAGPLWACAGTVSLAARRSLLVALRLAGSYRAVASRDVRFTIGAPLEIDWKGQAIHEFRPWR